MIANKKALPRHLGQHSGGMVICAGRLDGIVPLQPATMPGRVIVQWDKDDWADMGIIKVDLLGLGMMAVLEDSIHLIREHYGEEVDLAHLPPNDPDVYDTLQKADTIGLFQVESRAQMSCLPRLKPNSPRHKTRSRQKLPAYPLQICSNGSFPSCLVRKPYMYLSAMALHLPLMRTRCTLRASGRLAQGCFKERRNLMRSESGHSIRSYTRDLEHSMGDLTKASVNSFARVGLAMFQLPIMMVGAMMGIPWSNGRRSASTRRESDRSYRRSNRASARRSHHRIQRVASHEPRHASHETKQVRKVA